MNKREFILLAKALGGSALPVPALSALYESTMGELPDDPAPAPPDTAGIAESNQVSAWLTLLSVGTPEQREQFDSLRTKPYAAQRAAWLAAGSP